MIIIIVYMYFFSFLSIYKVYYQFIFGMAVKDSFVKIYKLNLLEHILSFFLSVMAISAQVSYVGLWASHSFLI